MKISFVQLIMSYAFLSVSWASNADAQDILNRRLNLDVTNEKIKTVLVAIEKNANVKFSYSPQVIKSDRRISFSVQDMPLSYILNEILLPINIGYSVTLNQIILKRLESEDRGYHETPSLQSPKFDLKVNTQIAFTIKGQVTDEKGEPLVGASVVVENTTKGAITDINGLFELILNDTEKKGKLEISFVGYQKQIIAINGQGTMNVVLQEAGTLNEVVVVGYGTQKRGDITGAVSKFKDEKLDEAPVIRLDQALQGKIAGVTIQNIDATAGSTPKIQIRGISSINAGANPLVVVDGQPIADGLAFVNMADVESVEVLKDAASAAIYGSRGASGVILITTKSGKSGKTKYSFKYSKGQKTPYKRYDIMTTSEYVKLLFDEAAIKSKDPSLPATAYTGSGIAGDADRSAYVIEQTMLGGKGTDFQSESLQSGLFQNLQLSAMGGSKDVRYFVSGGYQKDEGMMFKSNYEKLNVRAKVDVDLSSRVKISINLNPSYTTRTVPAENFTNFMRFPSSMPVYHNEKTIALVTQNPQWAGLQVGDFAHPRHFSALNYSGIMPDGSMWTSTGVTGPQQGSSQNNPKSSVLNEDINTYDYRLQSSADMTINLFKGLDFKTLASAYFNNTTGLDFLNRNGTGDGIVSKGIYDNNSNIDLLTENTLTYKNKFGNHSINILGGFTAQKTSISRSRTTGLDYPSDYIRTLNSAAAIDKAGTFGSKNQVGLISYLGRVNYGYKDKYLLTASFRADGSSYFGPGNKWGTFPSLSVGWVASEERFLKNVAFLSSLKFRASYGVSGNNRILDFGYLDLLFSGNYPLGAGTGSSISGQITSPNIIANKDITWENTFQTNLGIDLSVIKNRFNLSVDVYQSKTDKLLLQQSAQGFTGVPLFWNNIGSLENKGIELELSTVNISKKGFKWSTSANISHTVNKILELGKEAFLRNQGERTEVYQNKVGDPLVQFFGFKTDGVWLSQAQIDAAKADGLKSNISTLFIPGGLKLVDVNGDKIIDNEDRTVIGSPYPDFVWGLTNKVNFKAFDLSFTLQGSQGGQLVNGDPNYVEVKQKNRAYSTNRWLSPMFSGDGETPYSTNGFNWLLTDYVVEDASYQALREINVGYTLPKSLTKMAKLTSLRVYFSGQNLVYLTAKGYRGLNPEGRSTNGAYNTALIDGYQRGSFPTPKTFLFGVDLNF